MRGAGFTDDDYQVVGGTLVADGKTAWSQDLVVKVKEPQPSEYQYFREDLLLFTYLHLAAERELTAALMKSGISANRLRNRNDRRWQTASVDPDEHHRRAALGAVWRALSRKAAGRSRCSAGGASPVFRQGE